jgi:ATP-dependent RNA helicase DeaD
LRLVASGAIAIPDEIQELGLDRRTAELLAEWGFTDPTPIQERAIPELLVGRDVVGVAQTGSGKTVAFGAPMMERLDPELHAVQAIVLVPTRELAQQVLDVISQLGEHWGLHAVGLLGGRALNRDFQALERNPHIVVGTPGRIIDHLTRRTLSLREVRYAVLDEADQMLDIGFLPDIRRILGRTPRARQTALFSATMPTSIQRLIYQFMHEPTTCSVDPELSTVDSIRQVYMEVASRDKVRGLRELIERELKGRTLVFCKMRRGVDRVADRLQNEGVRVGALHGDMDQRKRDKTVEDFRAGRLDILIATNVAARGLDIPEITHVVNFDFPQNAEEYVHRIGRTGRAGRDGKAITFVCEDDLDGLEMLRREFGEHLEAERLSLYA